MWGVISTLWGVMSTLWGVMSTYVDISRRKSQKVAESRRKSHRVAQSRTESHRVAQSRPWGCEGPACGRSAWCQQHMSPLWPPGAAPQGWRPRVERESEVGRVARQRALGQTHLGHTLPPAERVGRLGEANTCERKLLRSKTLRRSYLHFSSSAPPAPPAPFLVVVGLVRRALPFQIAFLRSRRGRRLAEHASVP